MSAVALQSFGFGDQLVRVLDRQGAPWFVAQDVCACLEIVNHRNVVAALDEDEKGVHSMDTLGGPQQISIVSESGLYTLIFKSRKKTAVQFRKWVTSEVLPTLRTKGRYEMPEADNDTPPGEIPPPKLGTRDDRDAIRVAVLMVREMKDLYGQQAGRQMWVRLGFPVPDVDLEPAPVAVGEPPEQLEGDVHLWGVAVGLKESRRDATHERELYASYVAYCGRTATKPMGPERFSRMMIMLFGHEEHPEMIRAVVTRK